VSLETGQNPSLKSKGNFASVPSFRTALSGFEGQLVPSFRTGCPVSRDSLISTTCPTRRPVARPQKAGIVERAPGVALA
jgi:hypothetical protein